MAALCWAIGEARQRGSVLHVVTAWSQQGPRVPGRAGAPGDDVIPATAAADVLAAAIAAATRHEEGGHPLDRVTISRATELGRPATVLLRAATGSDLLVVGWGGRGRLRAALFGSVSQQLIRRSVCPIVIVPARRPDPVGDRPGDAHVHRARVRPAVRRR